MAMQDTMPDPGFSLRMPLCNRCIHRESLLLEGAVGPVQALRCRVLGEIPAPLLACEQEDCPDFEQDEEQARLFAGLL